MLKNKQVLCASTFHYLLSLFKNNLLNFGSPLNVIATLEEASHYDRDIRELKARNAELEAELKISGANSNTGGGGPASGSVSGTESVLSAPGAMLSTLARKVASQLGAVDTPHQGISENLEESMRKVNINITVHM